MAELIDFSGYWSKWDSFNSVKDRFEEDVHILILGTLHAGITYLKEEAEREDAELTPYIPNATSDQLEQISERQQNIWGYLDGQERFLRNMALVALISRLTHSINSMVRLADDVKLRKLEGYAGDNEFKKLWRELEDRFDIHCSAQYIAFIEPLRRARNRIVHHGGEANPLKPESEIDINTDFDDLRDSSFSKKYPKLVTGEGSSAEVDISESCLNYSVEKSVKLIKWLAIELRARQLEHLGKSQEPLSS